MNLILQVDLNANKEEKGLDKVKEILGINNLTMLEEKRDIYIRMPMTEETIDKITQIQKLKIINDLNVIVCKEVYFSKNNYEQDNFNLVLLKTERGEEESVIASLKSIENDLIKVVQIYYIFDFQADIAVKLLTNLNKVELMNKIRCIKGVNDSEIYTIRQN